MPGLGTTLGRGGATTSLQDLENADCVLIQGSSMAEAHPVGFRWVMRAKERGATVIHVDPRFSRTSAQADHWVSIRAGGDLAFLGGLIRIVLEEGAYFREYVAAYTNASALVNESFQGPEDLDGLFSGWDGSKYDSSSWQLERDSSGRLVRDPTLSHPRCVLNVLRQHFARYTPEVVQRVAGVPPEQLRTVAVALIQASGPERTAAICYAVGWTQHSKGVQIIRAAAILQLLLGNIGRPGGGLMALRGHASIQGSTDIPTLYDILPGYLKMPRAGHGEDTLDGWCSRHVATSGWWSHARSYLVSWLKATYGEAASAENDFGFGWLPRVTRDHSHFHYWLEMAEGKIEGLFLMGQNPSVGGQNARLERRALAKLKWLVVRDLVEIEPATFWKDGPEIERGELVTEEIDTEVYLLPAASHVEKAGTFTQTQRLLQWRERAVEPTDDRRSELWFVHQLARRLRERAEAESEESNGMRDAPLRALDWSYPEDENGEPHPEAVLREINGRVLDARGAGASRQVDGFHELRDDGSTACGCWIYSGVWPSDEVNRAGRRDPEGPYGHGWGYAWPADRRILYNRASARPDGRPWSDRKSLVWWDEASRRWTGRDVPDFPGDKPPWSPAEDGNALASHGGAAPFLMQRDGLAQIFVPEGLADGPLPTHYEPLESPLANALYRQQSDPAAERFPRPDNQIADLGDRRFPYVLTTYRLTEHHTAGGMSRTLGRLAELQPRLFVEISEELAAELGVEDGGWVTVVNLRGAVEAMARVTRRIRPLVMGTRADGSPEVVHQVAMPFHWGSSGPNRGDVVNDLVPLSSEPNVSIHESKALLCALVPGRRPADAELGAWLAGRYPELEVRDG